MKPFYVQKIYRDKPFINKLTPILSLPDGLEKDEAMLKFRRSYLQEAEALKEQLRFEEEYVQNVIVSEIMYRTHASDIGKLITELEAEESSKDICRCLRTVPKKIATAINRANFNMDANGICGGYDDKLDLQSNISRAQQDIGAQERELKKTRNTPFHFAAALL